MLNPIHADAAYGLIPIWQPPAPEAVQPEHRYLLILHQKGHWAFPKGHQEPGETALETAQREVQEETGLTEFQVIRDRSFQEYYEFQSPKGYSIAKTVTYFVALLPCTPQPPDITVQWAEVSDFCWCTYSEALERITFAANRQVLRDCEVFLKSLPSLSPELH
ncbi:MAG: bis(5'-nucleosyl)-tetraphosphatase [Prochlorotrichaceae cyanobacterium]